MLLASAAAPVAVAMALAGGAPAFAQDAAAAPTSTNAADSNQVGEVVVTAQFRAQNVQQTPLAITAVTADMLQARSQNNVATVAEATPGLHLTTGSLGGAQTTQVSIRGVGQLDFNLAVEPGVGMYIDDVYYGTMFGSLFDLIDTDRVEILRGPQGTLSGKNSEGGAIKLYSKKPTDSNSGYVEATLGNYHRNEVRLGANYTIVPGKLFLRVTGIGEFEKGFVKSYDYQCKTGKSPVTTGFNAPPSMALSPNGFGGDDSCLLSRQGGKAVIGARASLRWTPTDDIDDTLIYDVLHDRSDPPPFVLTAQGAVNGPTAAAPGAPSPDLAANFVPPAGSYYNYATYCGLVGTPQMYCVKPQSALDSWGISNNLDWKLGTSGLSVKSITAFRQFSQNAVSDLDGAPITGTQNAWNIKYKQISQELRMNGDLGKTIHWTVGGFYFHSDAEQGARVGIDGAANQIATFDFLEFDPVKATSKSLFGHVEWNPIEPLTLTGGVRYTDDYKFFQYGRALAPGYSGSFLTATVLPLNGVQGTFKGSRVDYRFTADWKFNQDISAYFETATGYKGGGFSPRPYYPQQAQPFNPEVVTAYELGLKSYLFDRKLKMNIAAYYNKYSQIQLTLSQCPNNVPAGAPQNCAMNANVGNATIKGFEVEGEWHPFRGAMIDFSTSYIDFNYTKVDPATLIHLYDKAPYIPEWKFNVGGQYRYEVGDLGSITPRIDVAYIDTIQVSAINYANTIIPEHTLVNARLTWENNKGDWSLAFSATNIFNKYYAVTAGFGIPPAGSSQYNWIQPGQPRRVAVTLRKTF